MELVLGLMILAYPIVAILSGLVLFYQVMIKKKRTFLPVALLFLICGLFFNRELIITDIQPSKLEQQYNEAVASINNIIEQDKGAKNPNKTKDILKTEIVSLRKKSEHTYLDFATVGLINNQIDEGNYKEMLTSLDNLYKIGIKNYRDEYENRSGFKKYLETAFFIGFWLSIIGFFSALLIIFFEEQKKEPETG